jgi:ferric enterobactin receptor
LLSFPHGYMKNYLKIITLTVFLSGVFHFQMAAQQPLISVSSDGKPLEEVLEEISVIHNISFAFDAVSFRKISTEFSLEKITLEDFLIFLQDQYSVSSSNIDGTWVLIRDETAKTETPVQKQSAPVNISGYVRDKKTGENMIYCNVACGKYQGGMTNELGFFSFSIPETDSIQLFVSHLGYHKLDTVVSATKTALILLEPSEIMLNPIRVVHSEREVLQATVQPEKIAFNPLKSASIPRISDDDLGNALLMIPGISFFQGGFSGLSIRGGSPSDNLVLFDGIPVLETSHLLGNISVLNAKFVQQAFVSRGGFDAGYGGRIAGLIELTGKSGKQSRPGLDLSANLMNSNVMANLPVTDKFSITAAWRRSFLDTWQNYLYYRLIDNVISSDEDPVTSNIIPTVKYQDINAKISFHPSDHLEFNVNLLYGKDLQSRNFELIQTKDYYRNERTNSENTGLSFNWKWQANSRWFHSFSAGFSVWEKNLTDETGELEELTEITENPGQGIGRGKGLAKTREKTYTRNTHDIDNGFNHIEEYRASWKTEYNAGIFQHEAGAGYIFNTFDYHFYASRLQETLHVDSIARNANQHLFHAFLQQKIDLTRWSQFRWGIRTNLDAASKNMYWQPRGGIEILPSSNMRFYFLSGIYYQFLSGIRRFDSNGHFSHLWYLPDETGQGIVSGTHYVAGGKYEANGWFIELEAYHKNTQGKMNLFAEEIDSGNNQTVTYFPRESLEQNRGIDLFIQKKQFLFNHMLSYSLASAEEKTEGFFDHTWFPGFNDRTHHLKLTEIISWKNWTITGSWQILSGLPVLQLTKDSSIKEFDRSDHFEQLDLALVKKLKMKYYSLNAGISLLNVFDRRNIVEVNYLRFSSDSGAMTVRSDISALGITPVFFIHIKF